MTIFNHTFVIADVAPPPDQTNNFDYCIKIVNLDMYPDYSIFVNVSSPTGNPQKTDREYVLAKSDRCIPIAGYRPEAIIAAIPKELVKSQDLTVNNGHSFLQSLQVKKALIKAENTIPRPASLPIIYAGSNIEASVKIDKLDRQSLVVSVLEQPSQFPIWLALTLIGAAIFGWLIFRNWNKKLSENK